MSEEQKRREIADRLRTAREYLELTQEEAAEAVGMSRSALSLVESGRRKVDALELAAFAKLYGQSIDALSGTAESQPLPESVHALARAATELSPSDRDELLRFAQFVQAKKTDRSSDGG
jgi:transcriptional regulator with XRE-family HTH domain